MSRRTDRRPPLAHAARSTRVALAVALAAATTVLIAAPGPAATGAAAADQPGAPSITVNGFSPEVGRPGGTLALAGNVRSGAEKLDASIVHIRIATAPVTLRDQLDAVATGRTTPFTVPVTGESRSTSVAAGGSRTWSLSSPLDALGLTAPGAYPLYIDLDSARTGITTSRTTTFLSWFPEGSIGRPTKVVWTVPLVGTPARDADGVFVDDRTAASIGPGGRLRTVLDAGAGTSASWVVDPELLQAASDMSDGYQVLGEDGDVRSGGASGAAAARSFLAAARTDLARSDVAALGYADPDVGSLQQAGLSGVTALAVRTGPAIAAQQLGRSVRGDLGWPPGGAAERATLATMRAAGNTKVLLSDEVVPVDATVPYTPTGLARIGTGAGAVVAALSDSRLSAVVGSPEAQGGTVLARARYLAETLVITEQRPSDPRTVVVSPPRRWDVDGSFARSMITTSDRIPWLQPESLDQLLAQPVPSVPRGPLTVPEAAGKAGLSLAQTDGARALGVGIGTFTSILVDPTATAARYRAAQLRTVSSAFRAQRVAGATLLTAVSDELAADRSKVRVLSRGTVTLSGAKGQVPITVANDLDQSVVVRVRLLPSSPVRLQIDQPGDVKLGPHVKETLEVGARAASGGTVPVDVALLSRDGTPYSAAVTIQVRSTVYSRVALAIVGIAAIALLALVLARLARRVRRSRSTA